MYIESLDLKNYRNYEELHMTFAEGTNVLYGDNGQGKTNILEAVFMCAAAKSHRGARDRDMIRFGSDEAHIRMRLRREGLPYVIDMHLKKNAPKGIAINGVPVRKVSELFGTLHTVCFSPEDLDIIKEGPAVRRRFMDIELCQLESLYVPSLINYNKILLQRNSLLKDMQGREGFEESLDVFDEQLVKYGCEVIREREKFINNLKPVIERIQQSIAGYSEKLSISYEKDTSIEEYAERLRSRRNEDIRQRVTLCGPHRDDIGFYADGKDLRRFGSQGQQRTAALSLKLAEIELVRQRTGDDPVLLLDDVLSELDSGRQDNLLNTISSIQTIVTCTGLDEFVNSNYHIDKAMHIAEGKADE